MQTVAIYPGTFDPVTNGHADLILRATRIFDKIIVAIAANPSKVPIFTLKERVRLVNEVTAGFTEVDVIGFDGLLVDCARAHHANVIIRGLRAVSDFEFEFQLASANRRLDPNIETVFMTPNEQHTFTSASLVKEIAAYGGDVSSFVHPMVKDAIAKKLIQNRGDAENREAR